MGRLFAFGCSFTVYFWPTWADILADDLGYMENKTYYNFAQLGIGNKAISQRILEADLKYNFTSADRLVILWSSWFRHDFFRAGMYADRGNVFNNPIYGNKYVEKHWDPIDALLTNFTSIIQSNNLYKRIILWQGSAFSLKSLGCLRPVDHFGKQQFDSIWKMYFPCIKHLKFKDFAKKNLLSFNHKIKDIHPDTKDYLQLLEDWICPNFSHKLQQSTLKKWNKIYQEISEEIPLNRFDPQIMVDIVPKYFKDKEFNQQICCPLDNIPTTINSDNIYQTNAERY